MSHHIFNLLLYSLLEFLLPHLNVRVKRTLLDSVLAFALDMICDRCKKRLVYRDLCWINLRGMRSLHSELRIIPVVHGIYSHSHLIKN